MALVGENPALESMLVEWIQKAKAINPDRNTNPAQTLQEYYAFVSWAEIAMPWALLKDSDYPGIFDDTFQSIVYFYFLIDQPLPELEGKGLVNNSLQYAEPFASWLITFSKSWGAFANGTFTHSFLNVNDYHRYHFPLGGTVKEARIIQGINPTGGSLWCDAKNNRYAFNPAAKLGWQSIETRGCVILETEKHGLVALLPIGMVAVGSVNFEDHVKPGMKVAKGDMLGNFAFGGSDFVMLFQNTVDFTIDAPKSPAGESYRHLLMGERLG